MGDLIDLSKFRNNRTLIDSEDGLTGRGAATPALPTPVTPLAEGVGRHVREIQGHTADIALLPYSSFFEQALRETLGDRDRLIQERNQLLREMQDNIAAIEAVDTSDWDKYLQGDDSQSTPTPRAVGIRLLEFPRFDRLTKIVQGLVQRLRN